MKRFLILAGLLACNAVNAQPTLCESGKCPTTRPVQAACQSAAGYVSNVGQAVTQPVRGLLSRIAAKIQNRPRLFAGKCR